MKIIFDNEEQKEQMLRRILTESCPHRIGLESCDCMKLSCMKCWEDAVEMEVKNEN